MEYPYRKLSDSEIVDGFDQEYGNVSWFSSFVNFVDNGFGNNTFSTEIEQEPTSRPTLRTFDIAYTEWHEICEKVQDRKGNSSKQILPDSYVKKLLLDFHSSETRDQVVGIHIYVKKSKDDNSKAAILVNIKQENITDSKVSVTFNIANVLKDKNGAKVYDLTTSTTRSSKEYVLTVKACFMDGNFMDRGTKKFYVIGKKPKSKKSCSPSAATQQQSPTTTQQQSPPLQVASRSIHVQEAEPALEAEEVYKNIYAQHVKAHNLEADTIYLKRAVISEHADVAYHFELENNDDGFEEGEIVGFLPVSATGEKENGGKKMKVQKMTSDKINQSTLKGVISRSYYLEAQKPHKRNTKRTETICMMGIVPVQVVGSVCSQDVLYVSPDHPGVAVSLSSIRKMNPNFQNDAAFIGIAFSGRYVDDENSIGLVRAAVSLQQAASQQLVSERMKDVEDSMHAKAELIRNSKQRSRKRSLCFILLMLGLLVSAIIILWQIFAPGTALRYWMCSNGHKKPLHRVHFKFSPSRSLQSGTVEGIEFYFEDLMRKGGYKYTNYKTCKAVANGFRYYLNINYCAYGGEKLSAGEKFLRPRAFAIGADCKVIYEYDQTPKQQQWLPLNRTRPSAFPAQSDFEKKYFEKALIDNISC